MLSAYDSNARRSHPAKIWLQLARHELTIAEAADLVDRSTIIRIRAVAKDRALAALAESRGEGPASGMWS